MTTDAAAVVRCEQVVLGWSSGSLLGGDGFGPIFASPGWSLPPDDRDAGLGTRSRFLPQGATADIAAGVAPPRCLSYEPTAVGTLLISKTYAARSPRPGQYLVHAAIDTTNALLPRDLWAAADSGALLTTTPFGEPSRKWPALTIRPAPRTPGPALGVVEQATLGVLLQRLEANQTTIISARDHERAEKVVRAVVDALPDALAGQLSLSTYVADPDRAGLHLCVAVPPFSRTPSRVDVDLDGRLEPPSAATEALVALLGAASRPAAVDRLGSVEELWSWVRLETTPLEEFSADDIGRVLEGPLWAGFLDRLDRSGPTSLLLDCLLDPELRPVLARRLGAADPATASRIARAAAQPTGLGARGIAQLQEQLVDVLGADRFVEEIVPGIQAAARAGGRVVVAAPALADLLVRTAGAPGAPPLAAYEWRTDTTRWSALTDRRFDDWLGADGPPDDALCEAVRREPAGLAGALDRIAVARVRPLPDVLGRLRRWPGAELDPLLRALLQCRRTTRLFALDVLGGYDAEVVRPLLRQHWHALARQAGLSRSLVDLLQVADEPRRGLWRRGR